MWKGRGESNVGKIESNVGKIESNAGEIESRAGSWTSKTAHVSFSIPVLQGIFEKMPTPT